MFNFSFLGFKRENSDEYLECGEFRVILEIKIRLHSSELRHACKN